VLIAIRKGNYMGFLSLDWYKEFARLKQLKTQPNSYKKCLYCRRPFNKGDYYVGNSRKYMYICRACAIDNLKLALKDCDALKEIFSKVIQDLEERKEHYDSDEMLNKL